MLLVGTIPKQALQIGTGSHCTLSLGRIANADSACLEAFVAVCREHGDPDIRAVVLAGTAVTCDKNDELLSYRRFQERATISQNIARGLSCV